ncbi:MAG: hypothetical protein ACK5IC_02945 [Moheibacter sp.]
MLENLNHFPINWVDGMKINKSHFLAIQDNVSDVTRDSVGVSLNQINYGLLPYKNAESSVRISLVIDNHKLLRVKVEECHAVTPNGSRIEISSQNTHILNLEMPYPEETYELKDMEEVVLLANISVNPFKNRAFGELDPQEDPPRYPYLLPTYNLNLVPENNLNQGYSGYQLTIGKILVTPNETQLIANYIPPCTSIQSHQRLIDIHSDIDKFFGQLELYSVQISQKIHRKNQSNDLASMILNLSDKVTTYLGHEVNSFRWTIPHEPPAYMFDKVVSLARIMKNFVDSKSGAGKEELLNYFAEWCGLSQGDFEVMFTDTVNAGYNHTQIDKTVSKIQFFIKTIEELFSTLNRLDYIGKRKDTGIFVKERLEQDNGIIDRSTRSKTFLEE